MTTLSIPERILAFNAGRNPVFLPGKFSAMRESLFRFYRGTSHLFNDDLPSDSFVWQTPFTWNVGDLHLENFGSFNGDNGVSYFDINDFDEAILAPCLTDMARLACSLYVAADLLQLQTSEVSLLSQALTTAYARTLAKGYIRPLERETATGIIKQLLQKVTLRRKKPFLQRFVQYRKRGIRFRRGNPHIRPVDKPTHQYIKSLIKNWAITQPEPQLFEVLDVAHRLAGTGSLGINRFAILVGHSSHPGKQLVLDLKQATPSTLQPQLAAHQPHWHCEAERIVEVQKRSQAASPALLHALIDSGTSYVLRALQPTEDKVTLIDLANKPKKLEKLVTTLGELRAWGHLRSGGRQGSSIADELIAFGQQPDAWQGPLLTYARQYAQQVRADYKTYCQAYDDGVFGSK